MRGAARVIPSVLKRMRSHRPQLAALVVLLAGSLLLTGLLAFQGYLAATGHRQEMEDRLGEWAERAAVDWDERVQTSLRVSLYYTLLKPVVIDGRKEALREPADLARLIKAEAFCDCLSQRDIRSIFVYNFEDRVFNSTVANLPPSVIRWITDRKSVV